MSFEPVTMWHFRCDDNTTSGRCREVYQFQDPEDDDGEWITAMFKEPSLKGYERALKAAGWELLGDRALCSAHVHAAEQMADASLNGLPFDVPLPAAHQETKETNDG